MRTDATGPLGEEPTLKDQPPWRSRSLSRSRSRTASSEGPARPTGTTFETNESRVTPKAEEDFWASGVAAPDFAGDSVSTRDEGDGGQSFVAVGAGGEAIGDGQESVPPAAPDKGVKAEGKERVSAADGAMKGGG